MKLKIPPLYLKGTKFGQWTLLEDQWKTYENYKELKWPVRCECGTEGLRTARSILRSKHKMCRSCSRKTHGLSRTPTWYSYH
jgi:hypothetical protein